MFTWAAGWSGALQRSAALADKAEIVAVCLRSVTAGFRNSKTIGGYCPTEHVGHLSWEISTQDEVESRGQPQTCAANCRRQVSELFGLLPQPSSCACHSCCWKPALQSVLQPPCAGRGRQGSSDPGLQQKGHFSKGWMSFLTQKDTHHKHVTTCLTLLDNTIKRQHMVSGGQDIQPPLDGEEEITVQERWELVLPVSQTLVLIPKGLYRLQCISSGMGAHEGSHGHSWQDGGTGRVVCQNGQGCPGEEMGPRATVAGRPGQASVFGRENNKTNNLKKTICIYNLIIPGEQAVRTLRGVSGSL